MNLFIYLFIKITFEILDISNFELKKLLDD